MADVLDTPFCIFNAQFQVDSTCYLKDLTKKVNLPTVVRITKGHFMNIGPARHTHFSDLLLQSVQTSVKVLAQSIKIKEKRKRNKCIPLQQKISIPLTYDAWFELLSEEGKIVSPLTSVRELVQKNPRECLVREPIRGHPDDSNGRLDVDRMKVIPAGEKLKLVAEVNVTFRGRSDPVKYLQCTDSKYEYVFLNFDVKGAFSPLGRIKGHEPDPSGVYTIKELIETFRLPYMVRLISPEDSYKKQKLTIAFRLQLVYSDEMAFFYPLYDLPNKPKQVIPIATHVALRMAAVSNPVETMEHREFNDFLKNITKLVDSYLNCIHFLVEAPDTMQKIQETRLSQKLKIKFRNQMTSGSKPSKEEDKLFQEIDQIYLYVRFGTMPGTSTQQQQQAGNDTESQRSKSRGGRGSFWEEPTYEYLDKLNIQTQATSASSNPLAILPSGSGSIPAAVATASGAPGVSPLLAGQCPLMDLSSNLPVKDHIYALPGLTKSPSQSSSKRPLAGSPSEISNVKLPPGMRKAYPAASQNDTLALLQLQGSTGHNQYDSAYNGSQDYVITDGSSGSSSGSVIIS